MLESVEAAFLRSACAEAGGHLDACDLSADGQAVSALLTARDVGEAQAALHHLPLVMQARLDAMSPINDLPAIQAPLIVLLHDRGDQVVPVGESRRLLATLAGRAGVHYTEMQFAYLDPVKGKLPFFRLVRELGKFFLAMYPLFRRAVTA